LFVVFNIVTITIIDHAEVVADFIVVVVVVVGGIIEQ
jgi:hypothetical protein